MRERWTARGRAWLIACFAFFCAAAAPPPDTLGTFQHTAFAKRDGAPGDVAGIVQGHDGFLWIIGTKGLTRFDGVSFSAFEPPSGERFEQPQLDRLGVAEGDGLWVTNARTGPTLVRDGHLRTFGPRDRVAWSRGRLFDDARGVAWAVAPRSIHVYDAASGTWVQRYAAPQGYVLGDARFDAERNLWVSSRPKGVVVYPAGKDMARDVAGVPEDVRTLRIGASGRVYVLAAQAVHIYRRQGTTLTETAAPLDVVAFNLLEDRRGNVWVASPSSGLIFISRQSLEAAEATRSVPAHETMRKADGLTGGYAWPLLEDLEGNVWVGTENGIDRFSRTPFTSLRLPEGIHEVSAAVRSDGEVWVGSETQPVLRAVPPAEWTETPIAKHAFAVALDPRTDSALIVNTDSLWRADAKGYRQLAPLPERGQAGDPACVTSDSRGRIIVCPSTAATGVIVWDGERWNPLPIGELKPRVLAVGSDDALWMGFRTRESLGRMLEGKVTEWTAKEGLRVGVVRAILPVPGGVWLGGENGIQFFDGTHFREVRGGDAEALKPVTGLARDAGGNLWAHTLGGVARFDAASVAAALRVDGPPLPLHLFGEADGVPGAPDPDRTLPTLRGSADGRLWAQTTTGLAWIDPQRMPVPAAPTKPVVEYVATPNGQVPASDGMDLDDGARTLRIGYAAPALTLGMRLHYRYRLQGFSDAWENVGTRREAVFTNLPPGTYRFEVESVGTDGATSPAAALTLRRPPAMHETWWFRALALLPLLALVWLWQRLHVRNIRRRMRIRADEREAVARDIHDTLLQRFHGFTLELQGMATDERMPSSARDELANMTAQARDAIVEGRERILALRRGRDDGLALYDELAAEGSLLQQRHRLGFVLDATGTPRPLRPECVHELRHVAFEAMRNAFGHSKGTQVRVVLNYAADALWLIVIDDGIGMPANAGGAPPAGTRFGLVGLRERVARIGGAINVDTAPGEGTEVHVKIPAQRAYARRRGRTVT